MSQLAAVDATRIATALSLVPSDDRDVWIKMAMAIKSELPDNEGFPIWIEWSQSGESYNESDALAVWRSIKPGGGIGIGSLFFEAKQNGWHDDGAAHSGSHEMSTLRATEKARLDEAASILQSRKNSIAAKKAVMLWNESVPASADYPYLTRKRVSAVMTLREISLPATVSILGYSPRQGDKLLEGSLLVAPVKIGDAISSCELIDGNGRKHAIKDGLKSGGYWASQRLPAEGTLGLTLVICEGVATALSVAQSTAHYSIAALASGNLIKVAQALRSRYPAATIILAADIDKKTDLPDRHAINAATAVNGFLAIPDFGKNRPEDKKDFNDLAALFGLAVVKDQVTRAVTLTANPSCLRQQATNYEWSDPEPLVRAAEAFHYPVDSLPDVIRLAVEEVQGFTQAPAAMVSCSALATLSLAAQSHHDVQRAEKLFGPIGLYFLVIAESGERKSTCDGIFSKVLRDFESQQQEVAKSKTTQFKADFSTWESIRAGLLESIKQEAKKKNSGVEVSILEETLRKHQKLEPEPPRVPRLIYSDFTPEALTYSLAKTWPSGGVISSEAGAVFGSHGMTGDSQMRTLSNLNQLWEAAKLTFDRRGAGGSYVVDGARLTMALQVQESALMEFFKRTGSLARGTGFLARFLIAHPQSTQGARLYKEPPENMPALAAFHERLSSILEIPAPINDSGGLEPSMLTLAPAAKEAWIKFHDEIEIGLGKGGELENIRDVASKIADNAVRMAALFHVIDGGIGSISFEHFECASIIAAWHLNEALRFFGELALPEAELDAAALDDWLIDYCRVNRVNTVSTRAVARNGPYKLRNRERMNAAVIELVERNRIVIIALGKKREIHVNPQLLEK